MLSTSLKMDQIKQIQFSIGEKSSGYNITLDVMLDSFATSSITYGQEVLSDDDPYVQLVAEGSIAISQCGTPGSTPVDLFPICTLPSA